MLANCRQKKNTVPPISRNEWLVANASNLKIHIRATILCPFSNITATDLVHQANVRRLCFSSAAALHKSSLSFILTESEMPRDFSWLEPADPENPRAVVF